MCGIAGYVSTHSIDHNRIEKSLQHRGPDSSGSLSRSFGENFVGLVHTRLSIIDLSSTGNQPMSLPEGVHIAFNGEIYNYRELKERFLGECRFFSNTDTEVLLRLWAKLGPNCIKHLNGDFAFSILDERIGKLFLVRDRIGVKPLYIGQRGETMLFASEIKGLQAAGMPLEVDPDSVSEFLVFKYNPGSKTLYKDVERLPPGSFMEIELQSRKRQLHKYWQPHQQVSNEPYEALSEGVNDILRESVSMRLHADVEVCNFFSGGLDSSIIALLAQKETPEIRHFTAIKSEADIKKEGTSSDANYARMLAQDKGLNLREVPLTDDLLNPELLDKVFRSVDDPIADGSIIPGYLIAEEASKHARVALSGMGADELFLGYGGHKLSRIAEIFDRIPAGDRLARAMADIPAGKGPVKFAMRWLSKFGQGYSHPQRDAAFSVVGQVSSALYVKQDEQNRVAETFGKYFSQEEDRYESLFRFELENFLVKNLHYLDGVCMANSLEARVPFLDHRLVELAATIPVKFKLDSQLKGKRILIDAFREILPSYIYQRRKAGFGMPLRAMLARKANLDKLLNKKELESQLGIEPHRIDRIIDDHMKGRNDESALLWALITVQHASGIGFPG